MVFSLGACPHDHSSVSSSCLKSTFGLALADPDGGLSPLCTLSHSCTFTHTPTPSGHLSFLTRFEEPAPCLGNDSARPTMPIMFSGRLQSPNLGFSAHPAVDMQCFDWACNERLRTYVPCAAAILRVIPDDQERFSRRQVAQKPLMPQVTDSVPSPH